MSTDNIEETETTETSSSTGATSKTGGPKRSASYPSLTVLEAYSFGLKIYNKFSTAEVTRKEIGAALGVHDLSISREVAAVASYGFFDKNLPKGEKDFKYHSTSIFDDVFRMENEKQKKLALLHAFGKPKLFMELINKFDGAVIPEELNNTLIKHHGITESASKEVADIFIRAGKEVGAINENRVLNYKVALGVVQKTQYAEIIEETPNGDSHEQNPDYKPPVKVEQVNFTNNDGKKIPIHLTKDKTAYLLYPNDVNDKDIKLLDHAIKGILLRLELERDEDKPEE